MCTLTWIQLSKGEPTTTSSAVVPYAKFATLTVVEVFPAPSIDTPPPLLRDDACRASPPMSSLDRLSRLLRSSNPNPSAALNPLWTKLR